MKDYCSTTHRPSKLLLLILVFSFYAISCGDDPVSIDEDPPIFPTLESTQPDLSYFDNNPQKTDANINTENYSSAKTYAITLSSFVLLGQVYSELFTEADHTEAEFKNGSWVWDYGYSFQGQTRELTIVATEKSNSVLWNLYWTYDDGEGNSFEDHRIMEGEIATDGNSGTWTFNAMDDADEETSALITTYNRSGDNEVEIDTEIFDEGVLSNTFAYQQDGNEHTLSLTGEDTNNNEIIIFWDTDLNTGFYEIEGDRACWDSEFQNIEC